MMMSGTIQVRREDDVVWLTLDRPEKRNALSRSMWESLWDQFDDLARDPAIRALVLQGAGDHAFCAGADMAELAELLTEPSRLLAHHEIAQRTQRRLHDLPFPTIAAIHGPCIGGGFGLAVSCDLRVATADARFGLSAARLGLSYSLPDTRRLVEAVGLAVATDLLLSGRMLDAAEAHQLGLVHRLLPAEHWSQGLNELVAEISEASADAVRAIKRTLRMVSTGQCQETDESRRLFIDCITGPGFREGAAAFLERRRPRFS